MFKPVDKELEEIFDSFILPISIEDDTGVTQTGDKLEITHLREEGTDRNPTSSFTFAFNKENYPDSNLITAPIHKFSSLTNRSNDKRSSPRSEQGRNLAENSTIPSNSTIPDEPLNITTESVGTKSHSDPKPQRMRIKDLISNEIKKDLDSNENESEDNSQDSEEDSNASLIKVQHSVDDADESKATSLSGESSSGSSSDGEWEVESIVGHAWRGGRKHYIVKWKGFTYGSNTIEPIDNLSNCKKLIKEYEDSLTPKSSRKIKFERPLRTEGINPKVKVKENHHFSPLSDLFHGEQTFLDNKDKTRTTPKSESPSKKPEKEDATKEALQLIKAKLSARKDLTQKTVPMKPKAISEPFKLSIFPVLTRGASVLGKSSSASNPILEKPLASDGISSIIENQIPASPSIRSEIFSTSGDQLSHENDDQKSENLSIDLPMEIAGESDTGLKRKSIGLKLSSRGKRLRSSHDDASCLSDFFQGLTLFKKKLQGLKGAPVTVENGVDFTPPPVDFDFIDGYEELPHDLLGISNIGCECKGLCITGRCSCSLKHGKKKHRESDLLPLYECNGLCGCSLDCPNRKIQREGRTFPLQIFRTLIKGWGLKALADIPKDAFIDRYYGVVLTADQADLMEDTSYQFNLDYCYNPEEQCDFVVDALKKGCPCRFLNHSCEPNCYVRPMFIFWRDERLPEIGFFAKRDISAGEELTFDYFGCDDEVLPKGKNRCTCNADSCRGYMFP